MTELDHGPTAGTSEMSATTKQGKNNVKVSPLSVESVSFLSFGIFEIREAKL